MRTTKKQAGPTAQLAEPSPLWKAKKQTNVTCVLLLGPRHYSDVIGESLRESESVG